MTADDWWSGTNADPILVPMTETGVQSRQQEELVVNKPNILDQSRVGGAAASAAGAKRPSTTVAPTPEVDVRKLTVRVLNKIGG